MVKLKYFAALPVVLVTAGMLTSLPLSVEAQEYIPYKINVKRKDPDKQIRKSLIMEKIRAKWPGRVLHITEDPSGGPDCHDVKAIGDDGEYRFIRASCKN